jgi:hypothetical protein
MTTTSQTTRPLTKRPLWIVGCLILLFGIPLLLATWLWVEHKPLSAYTTNHGQLIQPPLDLAKLKLTSGNQADWQSHWLLLYVNPRACDAQCEKALYNLRQVRTATGKDMDRVERAILSLANNPDPKQQQLLSTEYAGTFSLTTNKQQLAQWLQTIPSKDATLQTGGIYIVDPLGNVMMYYPLDAPAMGMFRDLTRLLKLSHIG